MTPTRLRDGRMQLRVPNGRLITGRMPGFSAVSLTEHALRDVLARQVGGATEACLPYGRPDVLTESIAFEVEPRKAWRHAVRQVMAYSAQTGCEPAVALFGATHSTEVLRIYLRLRDGHPRIALWWWHSETWLRISARTHCTNMRDPAITTT